MEGEVKERRKIQFSVPLAVPTQLDPRQVEMIRRRRPTPATLFRLTDHPSPEEENPSHQLAVCENGVLKAKRVNTAIYQPPSLKAVQKMVEAHMQSSEPGNHGPSSESSDNEEASPDPDRDLPDDSRSNQSEHRPVSEVTDEDAGSTLVNDGPGEDDEGSAESKDGKDRSEEDADKRQTVDFVSSQEMPVEKRSPAAGADSPCPDPSGNEDKPQNSATDDTRSDQSELHSTSEVVGEVSGSTLLQDVPGEDNPGTAESTEGPDKSAVELDTAESKEKGED